MIGISRKADYALVLLAELAELGGEARSAGELANATGIPTPLLRNVLKDLARSGLLEAARGPFGGYACARDPQTITVLDAVEAVGDGVSVTRCCGPAEVHEPECGIAPGCRIRPSVHRLHHEIASVLRRTTVADLLEPTAGMIGERTASGRGLPVMVAASAGQKSNRKRMNRRSGRNGGHA